MPPQKRLFLRLLPCFGVFANFEILEIRNILVAGIRP